MNGYFLTNQPFVQIFFREPGAILFGGLLMLMTAVLVLAFLLKAVPSIVNLFIGMLVLVHITLDGILLFDLLGNVTRVYTNESTRFISELFSTHRWLIVQIPILFTFMAILLSWVCRNDLNESHAREYVFVIQFCVLISFLTVLVIGYESLI
jgi:hypothetical protein